MAIAPFAFTKVWTNPTDFPTYEADETKVREDLQKLHDETKNYINNTLLNAVDEAIEDCLEQVSEAIEGIVVGTLPDNSLTTAKFQDGCVTLAKTDFSETTLDPTHTAKIPTSKAAADYVAAVALLQASAGQANGVATLDEDGQLPESQLPTVAAKVETGSYVGTGTYGSSNPNSLTFSFTPKMVVINYTATQYYGPRMGGQVWLYEDTRGVTSIPIGTGNVVTEAQLTWNNNILSWYQGSLENAKYQLNESGVTYSWIAIG